jgi:V8-like Glu-specific endopeptidase
MRLLDYWPHAAVVLIVVLAIGDVILIRSGFQQYRDEAELPPGELVCGISHESLASGRIPANFLGGRDDRVRVDGADHPWSAIGVVFTPASQCSGTLIGDRLVLTAGHCFPGLAEGRYDASDVWFLAGVTDRSAAAESRAEKIYISPGFREGQAGRPQADWALVLLDRPLGDEVGTLAVADPAVADAALASGARLVQAGYSADQPFHLTAHIGCSATILGDQGWFTHDCDVLPGDSGSPIMAEIDGVPQLVGVTTDIFCIGSRGADGGAAAAVAAFWPALPRTPVPATVSRP